MALFDNVTMTCSFENITKLIGRNIIQANVGTHDKSAKKTTIHIITYHIRVHTKRQMAVLSDKGQMRDLVFAKLRVILAMIAYL